MAIRTYNFTFDVKRSIMPEPVFIRQNDSTGATLINVHLVDNGVPVKINGDLEFRAMTADSQNVIADTTGFSNIDIDKGAFSYALPNQLSMTPGKIRIAYFMMVDASGNASTLSFVIFVKPSADLTPSGAKNYISIIDGLIKVFNEWNETAHSSWADFVDSNKEIIESIDPSGDLLTEVIAARNGKSNLKTRLDDEHAQVTEKLAEKVDKTTNELTLSNFDEPTRAALQGLSPTDINAVLGAGNVDLDNLHSKVIAAINNPDVPFTLKEKEVTNGYDLSLLGGKFPVITVPATYKNIIVRQLGKNLFNLSDYLTATSYVDMINEWYSKPIYLRPNTAYKVCVFVKNAALPPTIYNNGIYINQDADVYKSLTSGINLKDTIADTVITLTTDSTGLLYFNGPYLLQKDLDIVKQAFDIMIVKSTETNLTYAAFDGLEATRATPFTTYLQKETYDTLILQAPRATDAELRAALTSIVATIEYKVVDYTQLAKNITDPEVKVRAIEPLYVDSIASVMRYGSYAPTVMMSDERTTESGTLGNTVYKITGNSGDEFVTVVSGNIPLSEIADETLIAGVIGYDDGTYKTCAMTSVDSVGSKIYVYPPLTQAITAGEIGNLCVDGLHLSRRGYRAFAQNVFNTKPKYAEKTTYTDRFSPSLYLNDANKMVDIGGGRMDERISEKNEPYNRRVIYSRQTYAAFNPWDELLEAKSGRQVTLNTYNKTGYCEVIVGGIIPDTDNFKIKKDAGFEMYIEFYADDVLQDTYIKTDNPTQVLRFNYADCATVKVVFYYNKVRKYEDIIVISDITCWVNDYDYDTLNLLPKYKTVAQMFDSWGVFHNGESAVEMKRLIDTRDDISVPYENHSLGSQTSQWGIDNFYQNVETYHPQTMLIDFGINDANLGLTEVKYKKNMLKLCYMAIANGIQPIICFPSFGHWNLGDRQLLITHQVQVTA